MYYFCHEMEFLHNKENSEAHGFTGLHWQGYDTKNNQSESCSRDYFFQPYPNSVAKEKTKKNKRIFI